MLTTGTVRTAKWKKNYQKPQSTHVSDLGYNNDKNNANNDNNIVRNNNKWN